MAIFIDLVGDRIKVSGDTYHLTPVLGAQGLKFKFNKAQKHWTGTSSGKALALLSEQSGAILTTSALEEMARFQKAAEKRAAYMESKRRA